MAKMLWLGLESLGRRLFVIKKMDPSLKASVCWEPMHRQLFLQCVAEEIDDSLATGVATRLMVLLPRKIRDTAMSRKTCDCDIRFLDEGKRTQRIEHLRDAMGAEAFSEMVDQQLWIRRNRLDGASLQNLMPGDTVDLTNSLEEVTIRVVWRVSMWGGTQELTVKLKGTDSSDSSDSTLEEVWQGNSEDLQRNDLGQFLGNAWFRPTSAMVQVTTILCDVQIKSCHSCKSWGDTLNSWHGNDGNGT
eukprot:Skav233371  [mRNA]  locus=scaffold1038:4717:12728:+ [translate_table: standard]